MTSQKFSIFTFSVSYRLCFAVKDAEEMFGHKMMFMCSICELYVGKECGLIEKLLAPS